MENSLYNELLSEFIPVFKKLSATEVYSITLGGSHGKGVSDRHSDYDFRIFYEKPSEGVLMKEAFKETERLCEKWKARGMEVDGIFPRTYAEVDEQLEAWLSGNGTLVPYTWTVWGYSILTDIYNQRIIDDPFGKAAEWKEKLAVYPAALKTSLIKKYSVSLKYWRGDYHYMNKVKRRDVVFLASVTARLIQDTVQLIYALNEFYYPGDGMNLLYTQRFKLKPDGFERRVEAILNVSGCENAYEAQYNSLIGLVDDTLALQSLSV